MAIKAFNVVVSFVYEKKKKIFFNDVQCCCRLLLYLYLPGNLALCDAFNNLRIDEWRKFKAK